MADTDVLIYYRQICQDIGRFIAFAVMWIWRRIYPCWIIAFLINREIQCAKILFVSPSITNSIVMFTGRMADLLVEAGHEVTFWIPEVVKTNRANGTRLARIVRTDNVSDAFTKMLLNVDLFDYSESPLMSRAVVNQALHSVCEGVLNRTEQLEMLRREEFDLALSDCTEPCFIGLAYYVGAKQHIYISTGEIADASAWVGGIPQPIGAVPSFEDTLVGPAMSFWERVYNSYMYISGWLLTAYQFRLQNDLFQAQKNFPRLETLMRDSPLWFKVSDPFIVPAVPTLDKVINIAGIGIPRHGNLSSDLVEIVKLGRRGSIYFSLGTVTPTNNLSAQKRRAFFEAFASFFDYQFIMKVSQDDEFSVNLTRSIPNIKLIHWAPQTDLLDHEHVKLFISHGGVNSVLESAIRAKPMITIPLFFDQFRNAKAVEYRGYGRVLDKQHITTEYIRQLIDEVLHNPKYTETAQRLSRLYWSKPHRPDEEMVRWTNFVLENGPLPELTPQGAYMSLIDYFCLDIFALATIIGAAVTLTVFWLTWRFFKLLIGKCLFNTEKVEKLE